MGLWLYGWHIPSAQAAAGTGEKVSAISSCTTTNPHVLPRSQPMLGLQRASRSASRLVPH